MTDERVIFECGLIAGTLQELSGDAIRRAIENSPELDAEYRRQMLIIASCCDALHSPGNDPLDIDLDECDICCPVGDPDCLGADDQCHDACVSPADQVVRA